MKKQGSLEGVFYTLRYIILVAVIGSMLGAVLMFALGGFNIYRAASYLFADFNDILVISKIARAIDDFLFGTVLMIFSFGLYILFVRNESPEKAAQKKRFPQWLGVGSIDDLKELIGKTVLMILVISLLEHSLTTLFNTPLDLIYLSIGIFLTSAALFLSHILSRKKQEAKNDNDPPPPPRHFNA